MPAEKNKRPKEPIPFGKYRLLDRISHGGMAEVFRAKTFGAAGFERTVAIKVLLPNMAMDQEFITMLIDEAKIAGQLSHANIAQIFDLGNVDGRYYIVQEYVNGRDVRALLKDLTRQGRRIGIDQACYIILKVCEGLEYAHNKRDAVGQPLNLVHRDVSPQNILVSYEGEIKLIDFGIAKADGRTTRTLAGLVKGKFAYMSPEQIRGLPVDRRSDVFACGIVLHELLTGKPLFRRKSEFETLKRARSGKIDPPSLLNPKVPPELDRIVLKTLARHVEDRYQTALELREALWQFARGGGYFYSRNQMAAWMLSEHGEEPAADPDESTDSEFPSIELEDPASVPDSHPTVVDLSEDRDFAERSGELRTPTAGLSETGAATPIEDPDGPSIEVAPEFLDPEDRPTLLPAEPRISDRITAQLDVPELEETGRRTVGNPDPKRTVQMAGAPAPRPATPSSPPRFGTPDGPGLHAEREPSTPGFAPPPPSGSGSGSGSGFAPLPPAGFAPGSHPGFTPPRPGSVSSPPPGSYPPGQSGLSPLPPAHGNLAPRPGTSDHSGLAPLTSPRDHSGLAPLPPPRPETRSARGSRLWLALAIVVLLAATAVTLTLVVTGA